MLASPISDPDTVQATGRALALLVGLAVFGVILVTGLLVVIARRRARARARDRLATRAKDDRDAWTESARRMETPAEPDDSRIANPNDDTSEWDSPYANGSHDPPPYHDEPDEPEEDDPRGPFQ